MIICLVAARFGAPCISCRPRRARHVFTEAELKLAGERGPARFTHDEIRARCSKAGLVCAARMTPEQRRARASKAGFASAKKRREKPGPRCGRVLLIGTCCRPRRHRGGCRRRYSRPEILRAAA